jgi:hypothetical protein
MPIKKEDISRQRDSSSYLGKHEDMVMIIKIITVGHL